ncbi:RBBP9/YdeN family alpha/beta hydrolase [Clostridium sp. BJN0013]|uniref:RBBP9/YdeN family alpha/beta hydrolase n=1 Tax=Clostridium sp. BJN0013 TaxID=3236840 RepID=UPI0034C61213
MNIKLVPGLNNSGTEHWQSIWEKRYGFERVNQEEWNYPVYNEWEKNLTENLERDNQCGTVLIAHSLGCLLTVKAIPKIRKYLNAVFLVAPPDPNDKQFPKSLASFGSLPEVNLEVPGMLVYSENDPYSSPMFCIQKGKQWGFETISVGRKGHINSESNIDDWSEGFNLFQKLLEEVELNNS